MLTRWLLASLSLAAVLPVAACSSKAPGDVNDSVDDEPGRPQVTDAPTEEELKVHDPLVGFPKGAESLAKVCARGGADVPAVAFCNGATPILGSLKDLERLIGLDFKDPSAGNAAGGNPAFALNANSTALSGRFTSAINPAVILFSPERTESFVATMFVRGETNVEIAARDPETREFKFYLVRYEQACDADHSCTNGDRLTSAIEKGWTSWSIYRAEDLANTTMDCLHCHQPGGPGTPTMLRMQERVLPWTHWLGQIDASAQALVKDFEDAHPREEYGTIPPGLAPISNAAILEGVIDTFGPSPQPNEFNSPRILAEKTGRPTGLPFPTQPSEPPIGGQSATWQAIFDRSVAGEAIPVPYHELRVTDPAKLSSMSQAYRSFLSRELDPKDLPDIRDVLLDSALAERGIRPAAGLDGRGILVQMCTQCHNPNMDPTLSKSRFDVSKLDSLTTTEKNSAIARMQMDPESMGHMPPRHLKTLEGDELQRAIDFLKP